MKRSTVLSVWLNLVLLVFATAPAHGGGWVQPRGSCYAKVSDRMLIGSKAYSAEGLQDMQDVPAYQDHLLNVYGECGVADWLTITLAASPVGYAKAQDDTFYVGPLVLGARVALTPEGLVRLAGVKPGRRLHVALSFGAGLDPGVGDRPISRSGFNRDDGSVAEVIYQPTIDTWLGQFALEAGVGFGLGSVPAFAGAAVGARFYSADGVDHALLAQLQFGMQFFGARFMTEMHMSLYEPFGQEVTVTNTAGAGQTRYLGVGFTFSYWFIKNLGAFLTLDGVFYAESNAATPSIGFGLETRFSVH